MPKQSMFSVILWFSFYINLKWKFRFEITKVSARFKCSPSILKFLTILCRWCLTQRSDHVQIYILWNCITHQTSWYNLMIWSVELSGTHFTHFRDGYSHMGLIYAIDCIGLVAYSLIIIIIAVAWDLVQLQMWFFFIIKCFFCPLSRMH